MGRLTTLIADTFHGRRRPPPHVPDVMRERLSGVLRRRLPDRVADAFYEACVSGDLETAAALLALLEAMHDHRQAAAGGRRINDEEIRRAREELATRQARQAAPDEVVEPVEP